MLGRLSNQDNPDTGDARPAVISMDIVDDRLIVSMRLVLSLSSLLITYIDPSEPERFVSLTYLLLGLYVGYSLVLWVSRRHGVRLVPATVSPWVDVSWSAILIALSGGTNSIFFFFFFFAIMVASFRQGFESGLRVTFVSAMLFTAIGWAFAPDGVPTELNRFLLRPLYLLILGYLMAYWGGARSA